MREITETELREVLFAALAVPRWVDEVAAGAPYAELADLLAQAARSATPLSQGEIDQALAHHPRIGERPVGEGRSQELSRAEQASADADDAALADAIAEGNRTYEHRFDRVFLIRAAGRTRAEILSELNRRISLDDETEFAIVGEQLREIAILRLDGLLRSDPE